ncbi:MAG: cyclic nucleotide-binding protein [Chlamydiales bacterium]|jgi:CRP-like cAMP-binding protein|nr:cyclic nucleotide-binding protein [Chlamydiales bacterium]
MAHEFIKYLKVYLPDSFIITEGTDDKEFFCLLEGSVAIWKGAPEQRDKMVKVGGFAEKGTYFGEMGYLLQEMRTASIIAETQVKVLKFPGDMLPEMIVKQPKLGLKLCTNLANRLKGTTQQQQNITLQRNELRSDATDQLLHAKDVYQKVVLMLTAIQAQFQNPLLKAAIDYMQKDKLMQGGKRKNMVNEEFLRDLPPRLAELMKKQFEPL